MRAVLLWQGPKQQIIRKYTSSSVSIAKHAALASASDSLTWPLPDVSDYQRLARYIFFAFA